jgi:hypothetical protein
LRVAADGPEVRLWDARAADVTPLIFSRAEWSSFVAGVRRGEFDFVTDSLRAVTPAPLDDDAPGYRLGVGIGVDQCRRFRKPAGPVVWGMA